MDFNKYIEGFKQIPGIISVGIVKNSEPPQVFNYSGENDEFFQIISNLSNIVKNKIMGLSIGNFMFKDINRTLLCYNEQNVLLILHFDKKTDLIRVKKEVDKFLNDLLVFS